MTETQERFLRTILTRVPLDTVVEMHLFPPIRRGTLETGVAVIATVLPQASLTMIEIDIEAVAAREDSALEEIALVDVDTSVDRPTHDPLVDAEPVRATLLALEEGDANVVVVRTDAIEAVFETARVPSPRMRILTASYRHTIKGVERGKWHVDVQEEADAPLEAVERVLRGVRHRSTEPADPELVSHDALAALLTPAAVAPAA